MAPEPLPPGSRIGILGGGQLGRMLALAAARLGMRTHVFEPAAERPAAQVARARSPAPPTTTAAALRAFAAAVDVVTYEFENVPLAAVDAHRADRPGPARPRARSRSRRTGSPRRTSSPASACAPRPTRAVDGRGRPRRGARARSARRRS